MPLIKADPEPEPSLLAALSQQTDVPTEFKLKPGSSQYSKIIKITNPSSPTQVLLQVNGCNSDTWTINNLITGNVSYLNFKGRHSASAQLPNNRNSAPFVITLTGDFSDQGYEFPSTWTPGMMKWTGGSDSKRTLVFGSEWVAKYSGGGFFSGRRSGVVKIAPMVAEEGRWAAFDEIVLTAVGVAELVNRRKDGI